LALSIVPLLSLLVVLTVKGPEPLPDFDKLWDYGQPARTEKAFRELLLRAREAGTSRYLIELLTQIARAEGLQKRYADAHRTLDEAQRLLRSDRPRATVRYLLERGRVFNSSGQPDRARPLFLRAWELAGVADEDGLAVDAAHMLGIIEPPDEALAWNLKALGLAQESTRPDANRWLGSLYNNLGWTYFDRKDYPKSLAMLEQARSWFKKHGKPEQVRIARWSVAKLWRLEGRLKEALRMQQALLSELTRIKEKDGFVHEELAECLLALGRDAEARPHFAAAYELLSKDDWLVSEEPERIQRLKMLAGGA